MSQPVKVENLSPDEFIKMMEDHGVNPNAGIVDKIKDMDKCKDEMEFWGQFRGDYLDLRDFLKKESLDEKKEFLKGLTKTRVTLIREHILTTWTFCPELRDELDNQLEAICLIMYSSKEDLESLEKDLEHRKEKCGYYKNDDN